MPMDRKLYLPNWGAIARAIKAEVDWRCEFCSRPCLCPGESPQEFMQRICTTGNAETCPEEEEYRKAPRRFLVTVAHLNHIPADCERDNLRALAGAPWAAPAEGILD